jgi:multidrug efflux pump subunit AcrB
MLIGSTVLSASMIVSTVVPSLTFAPMLAAMFTLPFSATVLPPFGTLFAAAAAAEFVGIVPAAGFGHRRGRTEKHER